MTENLMGKAALVTGGAQGIGKAVCEAFLVKGIKVCISDIKATTGKATFQEFVSKYGEENVLFVECDVTAERAFEESFLKAKKKFGHLDILVNNAGICEENTWEKVIDVNLKGVMRGTMLAFKHLSDKNGKPGGTVVNTASVFAFTVGPHFPSYCASKFGVGAWTRSWGDESNVKRTGVKVCAICPDATNTDMIRNLVNSAVDPVAAKELEEAVKSILVSPEYTAKAFVKVLEDGVTGVLCSALGNNGFQYLENTKYNP